MEHVAGETLAAWMARHGDRGGIGQIIAILTRIASALAAVHQRGVIHRDLKPENVMIGAQGVRLLDFGLAKPAGGADAVRRVGAIAGTVHYLAPEVLAGTGPIDHRADLYSFGVLAYEMIAGQPPFVGERREIEYNHRLTRPPQLRERRDVSAPLEDIVLACLAKEADARPQDADTLRAALSSAMGAVGTLRGVGGTTKSIGNTNPVVLVWIEGGDPVAVVRAITDVSGIVVGRRGDGVAGRVRVAASRGAAGGRARRVPRARACGLPVRAARVRCARAPLGPGQDVGVRRGRRATRSLGAARAVERRGRDRRRGRAGPRRLRGGRRAAGPVPRDRSVEPPAVAMSARASRRWSAARASSSRSSRR